MYFKKLITINPYPTDNSRVRSIRIRYNFVRIFRYNPQKEPSHEDPVDGCDEYGGDRLLRASRITRRFIHTHFFRSQQRIILRSGSPGGDFDSNCDWLFDTSINARRRDEASTG